jgi:RNA polymerase sigma-70 factor (ECF subfamily)
MLVDAVLRGDADAYRILVERESRTLIGICARIVRDPDEAQDVAQEAFVRAYRALPTFRGDGSFGAWVTRIAVRLAVARMSAKRSIVALDAVASDGWAVRAAPWTEPEVRIIDQERRSAILETIATLPPRQREVVTMRFYGELSLEEIATATGVPLGTVKSRLHRALASLRAAFTPRSAP